MPITDFLVVSWQQFQQACFLLAKKILAKKIKLQRIVCISRGGLVTSRLLSDYLNLPISTFTIVGYTGIKQTKKPQVIEGLKARIKKEIVLLVDEVSDTGQTFSCAVNYLNPLKPKKIYTATPYIKTWDKFQPDFWEVKTAKWIIFPYEAREPIEQLIKMWYPKKLSTKEIKKRLTQLQFPSNTLNYFFPP